MSNQAKLPDWCLTEWERLLDTHKDGDDLYSLSRRIFESKCHPLQRRNELTTMMNLAHGDVAVEIGASRGGGLAHWYFHGFNRVASYEINGFPYETLFREKFPIDWKMIPSSSLDTDNIISLRKWLGGSKIDTLFIDGQKPKFYQDFTHHLNLMSSTGVVFVHDITSTGEASWKRIESSGRYATAKIIDTSESLEAYQRLAQGIGPSNDYEKWLLRWRGRGAGVGVVFLGVPEELHTSP